MKMNKLCSQSSVTVDKQWNQEKLLYQSDSLDAESRNKTVIISNKGTSTSQHNRHMKVIPALELKTMKV